ncbi:PAS domain-containing hybrid sensor histidine kinase/response regulator [Hymenobacter crusticola]|uniref:Sensory/regulatory protein RpfC n=1 Tax=Hymenobacter crusticola TaxID=1770526 RepID=A0A243W8N1_9BACT|nr:PAS domain-containing hybrid sensor histidine kinase/response regulator [Hymenobacter crusticola]OUJ69838.1 hypothetical protein BXP70_26065 [Hymenobacter crusticola]
MDNNYNAVATLSIENARLQQILVQQEAEIRALKTQLQLQSVAGTPTPLAILGNFDPFLYLVEEAFTAVLLSDPDGCITWINQGFSKLCGYELHEVVGVSGKELLRKSLQGTEVEKHIDKCLANKLPFEYEVPAPCGHSSRWIRVKAQPIFDSNQQLTLYAGLLEDITDRKTAQLQLVENEHRYRKLIENAPVVLHEWRKNVDGTYEWTYTSPNLREIFALESSDVSQLVRYIHPHDKARWFQTIDESERLRKPWRFEGRLEVPGQPLRWWRSSAIIASEDERGLLFLGILEDITTSMLAQEAMRESEQRWHAAMEGVGNDTWEYDVQTQKVLLSPKSRQFFGCPAATLEESRYLDLTQSRIHPDDKVLVQHTAEAYLRAELPLYDVTFRLLGENSEINWVSARGMITKRDEQGKPLFITGTYTDVTEITCAKLAQEAAMLRLSSTIDSMHRAILLEDENRKVVLVNEAFCRLLEPDKKPSQLINVDCNSLFDCVKQQFSDEDGFVRSVNDTVLHRKTIRAESVTLKDGRILERNSFPIYAKGRYIGQLWKYEDITKRKADELALKRREEKYRGILKNMNLGLLEADSNGKIIFVNDSYCDITRYSKEELMHSYPEQFLISEASRELIRQKRKLRTQGIQDTYEIPIKTKDNELKWLLVSAAPLYDDDRQIIGSIGVHLDITHQKQLEIKLREAKKQAEESARAKEMFLANMSHEIRTPMNAILGMSQLLSKTPLSGQQNNYLHAITSSAENLLVIINDILDLSKIDAGEMTIEKIGFSLHKVCEQVEKTLRYKAEDKGLSLKVQVSPDIPDVLRGDPYRITQVLLNLAGNSVKFTEKGEVNVYCELAGTIGHETIIGFTVSDTGIGIDPQYLQNLGRNFSQEDSSVSRKFGGTGLGLSISRSLVNLMGGEIHIESEKNCGTTSSFSLLLPIGAVTDLPRKGFSGSSMFILEGVRGKRVLLVEDNEYNRLLAKSFLNQAHIEVAEAENGLVAVELARQQQFDLILMDVQMPVMNGYEATAKLREELKLQTPIIALTANAIRGDNQKCLEAGMNDYLSKPFHEDELLKIIHEWLLCAPKQQAGKLYRLDILKEAAHNDSKFITFMLRTFLKSNEDVLSSLNTGLRTGNVEVLKAAAHKIKPSLRHLQIHQVLVLVEQLESWDTPFDKPILTEMVESIHKLLRQVMAQIVEDLDTIQPEPTTTT